MAGDKEEIRVVMLPWLAFGHIMPFFQLSLALAKHGVRVYFLSTPKILEKLPQIPPNLSSLLQLVPLPLPKLEPGLLPDDAEATVDIPFEKIQYLKIAYDLLQDPVRDFISNNSPHWVVVDFSSFWAIDIARDFGIPSLGYSPMNASCLTFFGPAEYLVGEGQKRCKSTPESQTVAPEWVDFPSKVAYRNFEAFGVQMGFYGQNASGITDAERIARVCEGVEALAVRTSPEIEGDYLSLMEKLMGKRMIPVGFLAPEKSKQGGENVTRPTEEPWTSIFRWLDEQPPRSVTFVGFGSETKLTKEQLHEIAYGVELSGLSFLWALRKPDWAVSDDEILPPGFEQRTKGRGRAYVGWAPQKEILAHPSVGGSLFHAGWGSIIETLQYGHSLVFLPFIIDQPLNARLMEEKGLGIEIKRSDDGSFSRYDIADSLKKVMVSEEGERYRTRAREAAGVFGDEKLQEHYMKLFIEYLKKGGGDAENKNKVNGK